ALRGGPAVPYCRGIGAAVLLAAGWAVGAWAQTPAPPPSPSTKGPAQASATGDIELVERLLAARRDYQVALEQLRAHYIATGDAAYQLGDRYEGKAYKQYRRAAVYFERCFQWSPNTQLDARLRAARLYDKHLNERGRAAELYRDVTLHETDEKRMAEAKKRLAE